MVSVCDFEYQKVIVGGLEGIKKEEERRSFGKME